MKKEGARLFIVNRTKQKGEKLASDLKARFVPLCDLKKGSCDILINTTPVGMIPATDNIPINPDILSGDMTVMDIVYNPAKTKLLKEAEKRKCRIVDGISMFVYQGAFQFELWAGHKAPLDIMRGAVEDKIL